MPPNELIGRLRGRRKAKVLVDAEWRPSPDFNVLADKIYKHIIRTDLSPLNGVPSVDVRKYLNWWKLRTCGRSVEFGNLAISLKPEEEEAAVCLLFDQAGIKYDIESHNGRMIGVLQPSGFNALLLWNIKLDPYESLKCINETTQSSDFKEYDDKKISFQDIPRSHLPETPDIKAQAILEQWKADLMDALRRTRSHRSSRPRRPSPERSSRSTPEAYQRLTPRKETRAPPLSRSAVTEPSAPRASSSRVSSSTSSVKKESSRSAHRSHSASTEPPSYSSKASSSSSNTLKKERPTPRSRNTVAAPASTSLTVSPPHEPPPTPSPSSSSTSILTVAAGDEPVVQEVDQVAEIPRNPDPNVDWRNAAWTVGSRVIYEALAAIGREHSVRTEERQLNMRLAAATAEQNQQFWTSVASWGAWSAHTAIQYYFGTRTGGRNLLGSG